MALRAAHVLWSHWVSFHIISRSFLCSKPAGLGVSSPSPEGLSSCMDVGGEFQAGLTLEALQLRYLQCWAGGGPGQLHRRQCPSAPEFWVSARFCPPLGVYDSGGTVSSLGSRLSCSCWARLTPMVAASALIGTLGTPSSGRCDHSRLLWTPGALWRQVAHGVSQLAAGGGCVAGALMRQSYAEVEVLCYLAGAPQATWPALGTAHYTPAS